MDISSSLVAAIASSGAVILGMVNIAVAIIHKRGDRRLEYPNRILEHRREALMLALQVIDYVYSNLSFSGLPFTPRPWDGQLARDADNKIMIYCKYPDTRKCFIEAMGLHNPTTMQPRDINPSLLDKFRRQVALELELESPQVDQEMIWICDLPGAGIKAQ
ncbi:MAG: hypothetical protein NT133_05170 [Alphaproteobacteria bacterium]|nr:hypothetical protein [Alphaproteobacteria bacterium]